MNQIKLYPHQQKALNMTQDKNRVAYYLDMGLGKTFVATEKAKQLGSKIILIVCQKSKLEDWKAHYEEYYTEYTPIIYKDILQTIKPNTVVIINVNVKK
ncbi:DEAD/DEAH box helicase family protein [uncultured Clostridium sp.]|uniref:DEAD/DEAH box helicase family protein n=1 Tax=uncultured Clostridium sp. TaxID=59620 RepID=UPI0025FE66DC|nr:DEAD/DEAH box helicase family protein [uncultured Clostridium sp.]